VLLELGGVPSRETRERVRHQREEHVRQPMIDLLNDLADVDPWYEDFAVWRGYPAGHPRVELLRHRSLIAARELESDVTTSQGPGALGQAEPADSSRAG